MNGWPLGRNKAFLELEQMHEMKVTKSGFYYNFA